jgi:hypothetical protein
MKNQKIKSLESSLLLLAGFITISWGIVGHERINKAAVMALPKPLLVFFTTILICYSRINCARFAEICYCRQK